MEVMQSGLPGIEKEGDVPVYHGYSPDMNDEEVRTTFHKRYGYWPIEIKRNDGCVLAGPVQKETE